MLLAGLRPALGEGEGSEDTSRSGRRLRPCTPIYEWISEEGRVARAPRAPAGGFAPCTPIYEWISEEGRVARTPRAPAGDCVPCTPSSEWISTESLEHAGSFSNIQQEGGKTETFNLIGCQSILQRREINGVYATWCPPDRC